MAIEGLSGAGKAFTNFVKTTVDKAVEWIKGDKFGSRGVDFKKGASLPGRFKAMLGGELHQKAEEKYEKNIKDRLTERFGDKEGKAMFNRLKDGDNNFDLHMEQLLSVDSDVIESILGDAVKGGTADEMFEVAGNLVRWGTKVALKDAVFVLHQGLKAELSNGANMNIDKVEHGVKMLKELMSPGSFKEINGQSMLDEICMLRNSGVNEDSLIAANYLMQTLDVETANLTVKVNSDAMAFSQDEFIRLGDKINKGQGLASVEKVVVEPADTSDIPAEDVVTVKEVFVKSPDLSDIQMNLADRMEKINENAMGLAELVPPTISKEVEYLVGVGTTEAKEQAVMLSMKLLGISPETQTEDQRILSEADPLLQNLACDDILELTEPGSYYHDQALKAKELLDKNTIQYYDENGELERMEWNPNADIGEDEALISYNPNVVVTLREE